MNVEQAWQSVLGQLQMEMPRASFDTWVRDTRPLSYQDGTLTIGVRNAYARDWLESRLSSTVSRLLVGIMNASVAVNFIVNSSDSEGTAVHDEAPPSSAQPEAVAAAPEQPKPQGILAFREKLASFQDASVSDRIGLRSRVNAADENAAGRPQRSMLTTNAPGSSGGINLASISRNAGRGGGAGGGMQGVQVGRATSSIAAIGGGGSDRPLARGGPGASRTDEEIQIVFDRYKAAFYRLYNRELRKDPTLRGQLVLRLTIEPDGSVSMCMLQASDMDAPELSAQVVDRVRTINFGAKPDVQALTIVYPIDFLPAA